MEVVVVRYRLTMIEAFFFFVNSILSVVALSCGYPHE